MIVLHIFPVVSYNCEYPLKELIADGIYDTHFILAFRNFSFIILFEFLVKPESSHCAKVQQAFELPVGKTAYMWS